MMAQYVVPALIGLLGSITLLLLGLILSRLSSMDAKLDAKQDKTFCDRQIAACRERFDTDEIWQALNTHCHTGLPADSKVTR